MPEEPSTPLMRQYHDLKQQVPQALLMFRLGDFYELFYDDAVTAARELEITLTSRNKEKGQAIPMCGVPHHSAEGYIARLIQKGYRVAVCEQTEDPKLTKKLVKREIARVVTPGTATSSNLLRSRENNYLGAVAVQNGRCGVAHVDISTGEFRVTESLAEEAPTILEALNVREVLTDGDLAVECLKTPVEGWTFEFDYAERTVREHFRLLSLDGCGLSGKHLAVGAAGAVLHYLRDTQRSALDHLDPPSYYERSDAMVLDAVTVRNLELLEPLFAGERRDSTLVHVLDETRTGMGGRLLRARLLRPSTDVAEIEARLGAVEQLKGSTIERTELRRALDPVLDLERLLARLTMGTANPRDVLALGRSLAQIPQLRFSAGASTRLADISSRLDPVEEASRLILAAIADEPPVNLADTGTVRDGYSPELDELRDISRNSRQYIAAMEARERSRTGIA
ncbi:MAG TPA: DNA mismatch repair protein MutS, partial [Bryobacteraceae bacterium]|nr:DNA mismatch repair protein MutS [Bryobacteraceae bacterium]